MSWRFPHFGSQQQQPGTNFQDIPTQSWYPPSVVGSSSYPSTPSSSGASPHQRASDHPQSSSRGQPSPAEAAGIIARLKDKSVDELQRLLRDKEAYNAFFNSLDQVKTQNNLRDELRKETLQLARENLEKEQRILELRNQCTIIRTTEVAAAQDRLADLERQKDEIMKSYSPVALLDKLQTSECLQCMHCTRVPDSEQLGACSGHPVVHVSRWQSWMRSLRSCIRSSWRRTSTCQPSCRSTRSSALPTTNRRCSILPARPRFAEINSLSCWSNYLCQLCCMYPISSSFNTNGVCQVGPVFLVQRMVGLVKHQTGIECTITRNPQGAPS